MFVGWSQIVGVDSQAALFFFLVHLSLLAMRRLLLSGDIAALPFLPLFQPFLSPLGLRRKVSQTLLKEKTSSSFELIHSSASKKSFSLVRDGLKR